MKKYLLILLIVSSLYSNEAYEKAIELEKARKYEEAMLLYKQLASNNLEIEKVLKAEESQKVEKNTILETKIEKSDDKDTNSTIEQILKAEFDILPYKDNYFLPISYDDKKRVSREQNEAKFQFSIKKTISKNILGLNETISFGYTQKSWWQIYDDSSPFRETNYQPEVFMIAPYPSFEKTALKAYKVGFIHESNGQEGLESRSWNRLYLEGYFQLSNLFLIPKVWWRIPEDDKNDDNPDITHYLGYGDFTLFYPYKKHTFKLLLRNNLKLDEDNKGFAELNWTFPFFNSKNTFGYIQMSSGYGDSLIDYDTEVNRFSFGISLSR